MPALSRFLYDMGLTANLRGVNDASSIVATCGRLALRGFGQRASVLMMTIAENDIRICFLGESFVNGTGDRTHLGWTGRLCQTLSQRGDGATYYNLGIRRETSTELLGRWQQECDRRLPSGCYHRVVFSFGVNDTTLENGSRRVALARSVANAQQLLSVAQQAYPILMVGPAAIADEAQNVRIHELSDHFAHLCETLHVPYLDIFTPLSQSATWMQEAAAGDGAHPNAAGYTELAQIIQAWSAWNAFTCF